MEPVDLLARRAVREVHQIDQAEVSRAEDDGLAARGDLRLRRREGGGRARLTGGVEGHGLLLVAAGDRADGAVRERALDELLEAVAMTLAERGALGLAVVGEHDQLVGPRAVAAHVRDATEALVEL